MNDLMQKFERKQIEKLTEEISDPSKMKKKEDQESYTINRRLSTRHQSYEDVNTKESIKSASTKNSNI